MDSPFLLPTAWYVSLLIGHFPAFGYLHGRNPLRPVLISFVEEVVMGISFSRAGKNVAHEMRHRVAVCGSVGELESAFSEVSGRFISAVTGSMAGGLPGGIVLDVNAKRHYRVSDELDSEPLFREAWYRSDLPDIVGKFAEAAWHRYQHLMKADSRRSIRIRI